MIQIEEPKPNETVDEQELRTLSSFLFNIIEAQITRADTKAGLVIAADSVLITVSLFLSRRSALLILLDPLAPAVERFLSFLTLLIFVSLFLSMLYGLLAARPALITKGGKPTLLFFGSIAQLEHKEFLDTFSRQTPREHHEALLTQVYSTAHIATQKFQRVRYSIDFLIIALILWAVIVAVTALAR